MQYEYPSKEAAESDKDSATVYFNSIINEAIMAIEDRRVRRLFDDGYWRIETARRSGSYGMPSLWCWQLSISNPSWGARKEIRMLRSGKVNMERVNDAVFQVAYAKHRDLLRHNASTANRAKLKAADLKLPDAYTLAAQPELDRWVLKWKTVTVATVDNLDHIEPLIAAHIQWLAKLATYSVK